MSTMEVVVDNNNEEKEVVEMEATLRSLLDEGMITSIEYRLIVSCKQLSERQAAVFRIMVSKNKIQAVNLLDVFRKLNLQFHSEGRPRKRKSMSHNANKNNPLLHNTVITCLFGLFTLKDIKNCRLVCQQWNSCAELVLRKKAAINFKPGSLEPRSFMETFQISLPNLPFTEFTFSSSGKENPWCVPELNEFFEKWGHNIKALTFNNIYVKNFKEFDVTAWIEKAANLSKLKIDSNCDETDSDTHAHSSRHSDRTLLSVVLDKLSSVKSLSMKKSCIVSSPSTENIRRFTPLEISLDSITWKIQGNPMNFNVLLNDFIDFSQASKINLKNMSFAKLNVAEHVFNAHSVRLGDTRLVDWESCKGNVHLFSPGGSILVTPIQLQFKELFIKYTKVNLAVLPQCLEKIHYSGFNSIIRDQPVQLPNLNFLCFDGPGPHSDIANFLPSFLNCANLSEMEINGVSIVNSVTLNVEWVPRNVRKLKLRYVNLVGDSNLEIDTLIVEDNHIKPLFTRVTKVMTKIQPRILVVTCLRAKGLKPAEIIKFVKKNRQLESIVVGVGPDVDLHSNVPFEGSSFSRLVDKKANYYEFENRRGQALTREEFESRSNLNRLEKF